MLQGTEQKRFALRASRKYAQIAVVFAAYFITGKFGLATPFTSGNISPVWPAAGVALAASLLCGFRVWPGIAGGAFLVNFLSPIPYMAAFGLAFGNTLAALKGGFPAPANPQLSHVAVAFTRCAWADCVSRSRQHDGECDHRRRCSVRNACTSMVGRRFRLAHVLAWWRNGSAIGSAGCDDIPQSAQNS